MTEIDQSPCECPEGYDETYHCKDCNVCCFGWGLFKDKYATYKDRGQCAECAMKDGMTFEEFIQHVR
jgi:hypothetical protein